MLAPGRSLCSPSSRLSSSSPACHTKSHHEGRAWCAQLGHTDGVGMVRLRYITSCREGRVDETLPLSCVRDSSCLRGSKQALRACFPKRQCIKGAEETAFHLPEAVKQLL